MGDMGDMGDGQLVSALIASLLLMRFTWPTRI
jgi:hypothetical protein